MTMVSRVGIGRDRHRLVPGGPLILGGVEIESDVSLSGHSDADALLHAITDAILGACGEGDIGELFPPTDERWRGVSSRVFLEDALGRAADVGLHVVNVDTVVTTEKPRLAPWKAALRASLADILCISADRVGVKAKTAEGLGPVGEGLALDAEAVVLLAPREPAQPEILPGL